MMEKPNIKREGDFRLIQLLADEKISSFDLLFTLKSTAHSVFLSATTALFQNQLHTYMHVGKGKVCIRARWPTGPELIPVSVT